MKKEAYLYDKKPLRYTQGAKEKKEKKKHLAPGNPCGMRKGPKRPASTTKETWRKWEKRPIYMTKEHC